MTTGVDKEILVRQPFVWENCLGRYLRLIHVDARLDSYWLLALYGFTVHDSMTPNAQTTSLEFSFIGPP